MCTAAFCSFGRYFSYINVIIDTLITNSQVLRINDIIELNINAISFKSIMNLQKILSLTNENQNDWTSSSKNMFTGLIIPHENFLTFLNEFLDTSIK